MDNPSSSRTQPALRDRLPWEAPSLSPLPRLTELTLSSGNGIPGNGDTGTGSTVIP